MTISGALQVKGEGTKDVSSTPPITFTRVHIPTDLVRVNNSDSTYESSRPILPASAQLDIEAKLEDLIDTGASGLVYNIQIPKFITASNGEVIKIPPLVCKFAALEHNKCIAREAWVYDEMLPIQGSVVARCFGLFVAMIPRKFGFIPRENDAGRGDPTSTPRRLRDTQEGVQESLQGNFTDPDCELLERIENRNIITMLLMEQLGGT